MTRNVLDWLEKADFIEDFSVKHICSAEFVAEDHEKGLTIVQLV